MRLHTRMFKPAVALCLSVLLCAGCGASQTPVASPTPAAAHAEEELRAYLTQTLAPQSGVMATTPLRRSDLSVNASAFTAAELTGLIGAQIADFDLDGQAEMLTLAARSEQADDACTTTLCMDMYEYAAETGVTRADGRTWQTQSFAAPYHDARSSLFTYAYDGTPYIGLHHYFTMNEVVDTLWLYTYADGAFSYVDGASLYIGGDQWFYLHQGQTEPTGALFPYTPSQSWEGWTCTRQDSRGDDFTQANVDRYLAAEAEVQQQYAQLFAAYGLTHTGSTISADDYASPTKRTTLDLYQATQGALQLVGALATPIGSDTEPYILLQVTDGTGELDACR